MFNLTVLFRRQMWGYPIKTSLDSLLKGPFPIYCVWPHNTFFNLKDPEANDNRNVLILHKDFVLCWETHYCLLSRLFLTLTDLITLCPWLLSRLQNAIRQACATYGPRAVCSPPELFLPVKRAFSIAENFAKAWLRIINCHSGISSKL